MKINVSIFAGGVLKGSKQVTTPCIVGRSKEADLPIAHPAMSRKHCELFEKAGNLYLRDNSSLNGTIYKGGYIESPTQLTTEDEFSVGELTFKITLLTSSSPEEQQETTDVATVATSTDSVNNAVNNLVNNLVDNSVNNKDTLETNESSSNVVTILEPPQNPQTPANENPPPKKSSKKISPKDVRIKI